MGYLQIGRYENCREQGYVFTISYYGKSRNYAVYEHRNSDELCVLISNCYTINTPNVNEMWSEKGENASKYDYDKSFEYGAIVECVDWIVADMKKYLEDWVKESKESKEL